LCSSFIKIFIMIYKPELTEETHTIEASHDSDELAEFAAKAAPEQDVLRVEEDVYASWSGVSGCCSGDTAQRNVNAAFARWVQEKLYQYRHLRYTKYGHGGGTARCTTSTSPWPDNRRSCRGSATVKGYIEFVKP
jgi:hypothetical protein